MGQPAKDWSADQRAVFPNQPTTEIRRRGEEEHGYFGRYAFLISVISANQW